MPDERLVNSNWWSTAWKTYHKEYVCSVAYQAYYLYSVLPTDVHKILELGAGSFRDTAQLYRWGYDSWGTDFSGEAVALAKETYPYLSGRIFPCDCTNIPVSNKSFDVCFHNGLLVCFEDNSVVHATIAEQSRVAKRIIVSTVHNSLNVPLKKIFSQKSVSEPLYAIRFFGPDEICSLLKPYCKRVEVYPYGMLGCNRLIKYTRNRHLVKLYYRIVFRKYPIERCERLMAVGYL